MIFSSGIICNAAVAFSSGEQLHGVGPHRCTRAVWVGV
jgi:hypothetical protein